MEYISKRSFRTHKERTAICFFVNFVNTKEMEKNVNVIPFHHRQLSRNRSRRSRSLSAGKRIALRENTADTRTRENYFKYITKFKSPLNHNARDSNARFMGLTRDEGKRGGEKKREKKKRKAVRVR